MKSICLILFFLFSYHILAAQIQEPLTYQAVIRNSAGEIVASKTVYFRLSILMGESTGTLVYSEFQKATTDKKGMVSLLIGEGTEKTGDLNTIPWDTDKFFLKVEIDIASGSAFVEMVTTQLLVVPFTSPVKQSKRASSTIEEDELMIIRKYVGTYLDYRNTGVENYGSPNLIWIKTSMEKIYGKISAYGRSCEFTVGENLYLKRTFYSPGGISGYWIYQVENNSGISYRLTDFQHDRKVMAEIWF